MPEKIKEGDLDFEIKFCEGLVKNRPNFAEALSLLGDLYTKRGLYKEGLAVDERLAQLKPYDPIVLYNLACSYSLVGELGLAFRTIKIAIKYGYDNFEHLENDGDLLNLRADARFQRYYSRVKKKFFKVS